MIDKFLYKLFGGLDTLCEWIANKLSGPRCQCKKKKNSKSNIHFNQNLPKLPKGQNRRLKRKKHSIAFTREVLIGKMIKKIDFRNLDLRSRKG